MPLTAAQIEVLKDSRTRAFKPANKADFAYFDQLLRDMGPNCPRLPHVWSKIFSDAASQQWLTKTFPGTPAAPGVQVLAPGQPAPKDPKMLNTNMPTAGVVNKAFTVLQSYRRS